VRDRVRCVYVIKIETLCDIHRSHHWNRCSLDCSENPSISC